MTIRTTSNYRVFILNVADEQTTHIPVSTVTQVYYGAAAISMCFIVSMIDRAMGLEGLCERFEKRFSCELYFIMVPLDLRS